MSDVSSARESQKLSRASGSAWHAIASIRRIAGFSSSNDADRHVGGVMGWWSDGMMWWWGGDRGRLGNGGTQNRRASTLASLHTATLIGCTLVKKYFRSLSLSHTFLFLSAVGCLGTMTGFYKRLNEKFPRTEEQCRTVTLSLLPVPTPYPLLCICVSSTFEYGTKPSGKLIGKQKVIFPSNWSFC